MFARVATGCPRTRLLFIKPIAPPRLQDFIIRCHSTAPLEQSGKVWRSADEALADVSSGSVILSAGFGLCGTPETLIQALAKRDNVNKLTAVSNNAGVGDSGLAPLIKTMQISKILMSFIGPNKVLEEAYLTGQIAVELIPQGTLAERIACGGKGIPGFYTATGAGTLVETGGIAQKFAARKLTDKASVIVEIPGTPKEVKVFEDGKRYLLEPAIRGDVALIRAWKVDKAGNCIFRYTTRAFGGLMARAADLTVVEAEEIVEIGDLNPMDVNLPGIYVDRIVPATVKSKIDILKTATDPKNTTEKGGEDQVAGLNKQKDPARLRRERIARRAAKEIKDGYYCNLGVGMPTLSVDYLEPGIQVWLQSENGILGMGPYPTPNQVDPDVVNAGKETVTLAAGASVFDSAESFGMIRGGHVDVSILGAMQVSASGDLASYSIPGKLIRGMGGSMDLCSNPERTKIIVTMDHVDKDGNSKIRKRCSLPLTATNCVSRIITDLCVFDVDRTSGALTLVELAEGVSQDEVASKTEAPFFVADVVGVM